MNKKMSTISKIKLWLIRLMWSVVPSCKDVSVLISESMDRKLTIRKRWGVALHIMICKWCNLYRKQLFLIRHLIQNPDWREQNNIDGESRTLSVEGRNRIKETLKRM